MLMHPSSPPLPLPAESEPLARDTEPLLRVEGLTRRFRPHEPAAVEGMSFTLNRGEFLALLGPSGCGKTTALRMIAGFESPDAGRVFLEGEDVTGTPPEKRGIGFVFQDYALFPHLTVLDNVRFGLRHMKKAEAEARARTMLALVNLTGLDSRLPHELSGGQQQRVALARTLALAPKLVLLDEPFSNLDTAMRVETRQEVASLLRQAGSAVILVTHDQEEALAMADRIAVMESGRVFQIGAPREVYSHPATEFVAQFIGRANIIEGLANGRSAETGIGTIPLNHRCEGPVRIALLPEQLVLSAETSNPHARIIGREYRGHDLLYWLESTGGQRLLALTPPETDLSIGDRVRLSTTGPVSCIGEACPDAGKSGNAPATRDGYRIEPAPAHS